MNGIVRAYTAGATKEGLGLCAEKFEAQSGIHVEARTTHGHLIEQQVIGGEVSDDIVLLPSHMIDNLAARELVSQNHRIALGTIKIGAAVRDGAPIPDVSTMAAFETALLTASSIVITEAPSGRHLDRVFAQRGLSDRLSDHIIRYDMGYMVNDHLVASDTQGEIAFGVATEISFYRDKGVTYAGPLPEEIQMSLKYEAAMLVGSAKSADVETLFGYLTSPGAHTLFAKTGVEI